MKVEALCKELEEACKTAFESGVEVTDAEKLAARCLQAQIVLARELEKLDLDSRLRKNGVKAVRARIYLDEVSKADKKPSDTMLEQICNIHKDLKAEAEFYDIAEAHRESVERYLAIFKDGHIYFRTVARGSFG